MDWFLDTTNPDAVSELRSRIVGHLARHGETGSDIDGAELAVAELVANAARHAAGPAWVSLDWSDVRPRVIVHDLGPGFELVVPESAPPLEQEGGRGLFLVSTLAVELRVAHKKAGGSRVEALLPVRRAVTAERRTVPARRESLPLPEEASSEGTFGTESFLRALVVHLAEAVEEQHGPAAAADAVAEVGAHVGARMEDEYRRAREIVDKLTPDRIADLFVRLKAAINGDFSVVEANEERIVLTNRRCPFGDVVKRSPSLCRMTSSVFGGIAARNTGHATVQLEERIAVGDPECRVIVWLGDTDPARDEPAYGHEYTVAPGA